MPQSQRPRRGRTRIRVYWRNLPRASVRLLVVREREVGPRDVVSDEEAAAVLRTPRATVRRAVFKGQLRARQHNGEYWIPLREVLRFLEDQEDLEASRQAIADAERHEARRPGSGYIPLETVIRRFERRSR